MDISFQSLHKEGESNRQTHCEQEVLEMRKCGKKLFAYFYDKFSANFLS